MKIYTTETCPSCKVLKAYLKKKGVKYDEVDAEKNPEEMIEKSGCFSVPQIEINGKMIIGFNKEEIDKELGLCK